MMNEKLTFEEALKRLEEIVTKLESGEVPLDESIKVFEEGNKLIKFCTSKLDTAETTIKKMLKESDGKFSLEDL